MEFGLFIPDENGGCKNSKICVKGNNHCLECNDEGNLCKKCEESYFPDENGGCSYTNNCEISYDGECFKCKEDYILTGSNSYYSIEESLKKCKSLNSEDLKNCENIDTENGICVLIYLNKIHYYIFGKLQMLIHNNFVLMYIFYHQY